MAPLLLHLCDGSASLLPLRATLRGASRSLSWEEGRLNNKGTARKFIHRRRKVESACAVGKVGPARRSGKIRKDQERGPHQVTTRKEKREDPELWPVALTGLLLSQTASLQFAPIEGGGREAQMILKCFRLNNERKGGGVS